MNAHLYSIFSGHHRPGWAGGESWLSNRMIAAASSEATNFLESWVRDPKPLSAPIFSRDSDFYGCCHSCKKRREVKTKCRRSERRHLNSSFGNSNAAVVVVGFCINQLPAFPLSALRSTLGNILQATVILFYFFSKSVFPYKTRF